MIKKRSVVSWCLFDWAHSVYPALIVTFIFSTYLTKSVASTPVLGTQYFSTAIAIAGVIMAVLSPFLGAIADYSKGRKKWLAVLVSGILLASILMFFTQPKPSWLIYGVILLSFGNLCYELSLLFYNSLLIDLVTEKEIGRVSGWGWGIGYFGSNICLMIALFFFVKGHWLSHHNDLNIRATTLLVAVWFAIFSLPLFLWTPDNRTNVKPAGQAIKAGLFHLFQSFREMKKNKSMFCYILAHMFYIDGVNTLLAFIGIYAAGVLHMPFSSIILFAIVSNIVGGVGAIGLSYLDDAWGSKQVVTLCLVCIIVLTIFILSFPGLSCFWTFGLCMSFFMGAVQAASRSLMAHLIDKDKISQSFGLYNLSGRITTFIGPMFVALLVTEFHSQRLGLSVTILLMLLGLFLLKFVKMPVSQ